MSLSPERKGRLTASIFAAAIGLNPYMSKQKLFRELTGIDEPFKGNDATQYGNDNEQNAVDAYESEMGVLLDWTGDNQTFKLVEFDDVKLGCTPDGFDVDKSLVVEFKCPYTQVLYEDVPSYYMPQIMGQMAITGLTKCHFVCWTPDDLAIWEVEFNQEYWDIELECLKKFWQSWQDNVEPKRSKKPAMPDIVKNRIY